MDWDWEEGPPRDAPQRRPEEPPPGAAPGASGPEPPDPEPRDPEPPAPETTFSSAVEHFGRPLPQDGDAAPPPHLDEPSYFTDDRARGVPNAPDGHTRDEFAPEKSHPAQRAPEALWPPAQVDRAARRAQRRRQIRRRRLVALAVAAAVVVLITFLAVRGCGGSSSEQAAATARPSATPAALRVPTADQPLRMAAYGESVGGGALLGIKLLTEERADIKVHRFVKVASGLTRPDFFDWPAYLKQDMEKRKRPFEAVALMFGANDGQDTKVDGKQLTFGSGSWKAMYAKRVGAVMDYYLRNGVQRIYWAGMPRMGIKWFNERMQVMNAIYEAEAEKRAPRVAYVDIWAAVDAPATTYQAEYRQDDGVHLTVEGGMKASEAVMKTVAEDWRLPAFGEAE